MLIMNLRLLISIIANLILIKLMSFIFFILENEVLILKMNLDDFSYIKKSFSHIRKRIFNIKNIFFL